MVLSTFITNEQFYLKVLCTSEKGAFFENKKLMKGYTPKKKKKQGRTK